MAKIARNDITGDALRSRTLSKEGQDNWDKIFGKKKHTTEELNNEYMEETYVEGLNTPANKPVEPVQLDLFDEERIDTIGSNGNEGLHYEETK